MVALLETPAVRAEICLMAPTGSTKPSAERRELMASSLSFTSPALSEAVAASSGL